MSYKSTTFNVMIASPGDVAAERAMIRDAVYEWNAVNSISRRIVLMPVGWETHASPDMGATAQEVINQQVLDKCDLLVGVFWTRIGTATDKNISGSVEEIEAHIAKGKPAMLYFSSQPVVIDSVDSDQIQKLNSFKSSCFKRGLCDSYHNHSDFKEKFYRHLQLKINEHSLFQVEASSQQLDEINESRSKFPNLSYEAKILLKEASQDSGGNIIHMRYIGGSAMQVNGKNLISSSDDRREVAKWEDALSQLATEGLVVDYSGKGEVFQITNLGYQTADMIAL